MRARQYNNAAERQRAYRERRKRNNKQCVTEALASAAGTSAASIKLAGRVLQADPTYQARIMSGEISLHAAALELGLISKRVSVSTTDIGAAVEVLLRHYTADQLLTELVLRGALDHLESEASNA